MTPDEIATLKIFAKYASTSKGKTSYKSGSKEFNTKLADLVSNISYERAKTPKPAATKPIVAAKPVVAAKPSLRDIKAKKDADQKAKNAERLAEIKRNNAAQKAKNNPDGTKKK